MGLYSLQNTFNPAVFSVCVFVYLKVLLRPLSRSWLLHPLVALVPLPPHFPSPSSCSPCPSPSLAPAATLRKMDYRWRLRRGGYRNTARRQHGNNQQASGRQAPAPIPSGRLVQLQYFLVKMTSRGRKSSSQKQAGWDRWWQEVSFPPPLIMLFMHQEEQIHNKSGLKMQQQCVVECKTGVCV